MPLPPFASCMLEQEARALLTRLARVKPLAMQESMLPAAGLLPETEIAIERFLITGRWHLRSMIMQFLDWLRSPEAARSDAETAQRHFVNLRLRFTRVLTHFDLFENVITQRSENETGVWLSGLDVVSADALHLQTDYFTAPPIVCYLDRSMGAAIRRSRTRLPGGGDNPVAIIRIPRERMVGSGIASSLVHEVGHQAAALLSLVESLRPLLRLRAKRGRSENLVWKLWERWIGEIVADLWAVARVGIASTLGLMGVVSLPRVFVFRVNTGDPHPAPWIRVKLSAALGESFYPQAGWNKLVELWESYYPRRAAAPQQLDVLLKLEETIPELVELLVNHRPAALRGHSLREALDSDQLQPSRLRTLLGRWRHAPHQMYRTRPIVVFAAIGQGRVDGRITPEEESTVIGKLLSHWALWSTLQAVASCGGSSWQELVRPGVYPSQRAN